MLAAGVLHRVSLAVSICTVTLIPRAGMDSSRVRTTGTLTHGPPGDRHSPAGFAITNEPGAVVNTLSTKPSLPVHPLTSVTETVNTELPGVVGVPAMTPVAAASESPSGSVPLASAQVYGPIPPETVSVSEYGTATTPASSPAGPTASESQPISRV